MCIYAFSFLLAKNRELQPSSAKLLLPMIPIGIVVCASVLLWNTFVETAVYNEVTPSPKTDIFTFHLHAGSNKTLRSFR